MAKILVVENDDKLRRMMVDRLSVANYRVVKADDYQSAIRCLDDNSFDLVIINTQLGETQTNQILNAASRESNTFLLINANGNTQLPLEEMQGGVYHFLRYPFTIRELMAKVRNALDRQRLIKEVDYLHHEQKYIYNFKNIVGESPKLKKIFEVLKKVARSNTTVLITGDTGTGKELVAGAIHFNSPRRHNSFITVNCAALPDGLLESELFGHDKGAFTGAHKQRKGRCEQADKGTLFLDEVSEMVPMTQAKILRFLENQELVRVGGNETIKVDVRIVAATNKNLLEEVNKGTFREDLYYRLNVVHVHIPPLRERRDDIPLLANFFLDRHKRRLNKKEVAGFDDETMKLLIKYHWPGNVRELENVIERAMLMCEDKYIHAEDIFYIEYRHEVSPGVAKNIILPPGGITLEEVEKSLIIQALERESWIQKDAAALLGLSRRVMQYKIGKYHIKNPRWPKNR